MAIATAERGRDGTALFYEFAPIRPELFLRQHPVYWGEGIPAGDGHPVMTIPGLAGSDMHFITMRAWLNRIGYKAIPSGIFINLKPRAHVLEIQRRLEQVVTETRQRASLIGWSLGGIYALGLALSRPDLVKTVVTMGTPLSRDIRESAHPLIRTIGTALIPMDEISDSLLKALPSATLSDKVSLVSIYSKTDGVVNWEACVDPRAKNMEILSTHLGYPWNPFVYEHLANALAGKI